MEDWKEYKLEDISKSIFAGGDASKFSCKKYKTDTYSIPIYANAIENDGLYGYTNTAIVHEPAVTIAARGAGTGNVIYRDKPFTPIVRLISIIPNNNVNPLFLACALQLKNLSGDGSAIPQLTVPEVKKMLIKLPSLNTQNRIANFIEKLNQKIALNRRINGNLEQQAQALFKAWFVDFEPFKDGKFVDSELGMIPEGWKVGNLSDIANITMGQSPDGKSYNECGDGMIFYQGRAEFGYRFPYVRLYTTQPKKIAEPLSILLSVRAPVGDINIAYYKCCIGRGLAAIQCTNKCQSFLFYLIQSLKPIFNQYNGEGTVFGSISKEALSNIRIVIPKIEVINRFESIAKNIDRLILQYFLQIKNLESLRDTLLPRLMSGELNVNTITE